MFLSGRIEIKESQVSDDQVKTVAKGFEEKMGTAFTQLYEIMKQETTGQAGNIQTAIGNLQKYCDQLNDRINREKTKSDRLVSEMQSVREAMANLQKLVENLQKELDTHKEDTGKFKETVLQYVGDMETEIQSVKDIRSQSGEYLKKAGELMANPPQKESK
jgi:ABC-type transporter Mla subunit MlaD